MTRTVGMVVVIAVVLGVCQPLAAAGRGTTRGVVVETDAWKAENGQLMLSVTIQGEGPWHATFSVQPGNREAYAAVGSLREGDRVTVGWTKEDDVFWVREIVRKEGEREEAEAREVREREGDERERRERGERGRKERGERELHERGESEKQEREERDRDRERRKDLEPDQGERTERRDRERADRRRGTARGSVVGIDDYRGENGKVILMVILAGEGDRRATFRLGEGNREAFKRAKGLKPGDRVALGWVAEGDQKWIREIAPAEGAERRDRERGERRGREPAEREAHVSREGRTGLEKGERRTVVERGREKAVEAARTERTKATVISVIRIKPGDPRTLTVVRTDNGKPMTFKVGPDRTALYESVAKLLPGTRVLVVFVETKDGLQLREVGRPD